MKKIIAFVFLSNCLAFGQKKILIFHAPTNTNQAEILWHDALNKKILVDTSSNVAKISEQNLKNYHAVVFLNTSINVLNFRQSTDLQRFMQAGGGFVGICAALEKTHRWLWYNQMLGGVLSENQSTDKVELNLITNASLGQTELPPLWKISDKPLIIKTLPIRCKPILLDIDGRTWAWHYTSEEGGKMFYTALGADISVFQNPLFLSHIWAGIEEVVAENLPDYTTISATALPSETNFLKIILSDNLENPLVLTTLPNRNVLMVEQNGNIKLFNAQKQKTIQIGKLNTKNIKAIRPDPEFAKNGYIYTFSEDHTGKYKIGSIKLSNDSTAMITNFSSQSDMPLPKNIIYEFDKYANQDYRLPPYFSGKSFRFDNEQGFIIETFDGAKNIKNIEPFLPNTRFDFIKDMTFGLDGELYFLEDKRLVKINYSEKNRKPIAVASANILSGDAPLKVKLLSEGSVDYDKKGILNFEWSIIGTTTKSLRGANIEHTFLKAGTYEIKLQVSDQEGESAETFLKIEVRKPTQKKK